MAASSAAVLLQTRDADGWGGELMREEEEGQIDGDYIFKGVVIERGGVEAMATEYGRREGEGCLTVYLVTG